MAKLRFWPEMIKKVAMPMTSPVHINDRATARTWGDGGRNLDDFPEPRDLPNGGDDPIGNRLLKTERSSNDDDTFPCFRKFELTIRGWALSPLRSRETRIRSPSESSAITFLIVYSFPSDVITSARLPLQGHGGS